MLPWYWARHYYCDAFLSLVASVKFSRCLTQLRLTGIYNSLLYHKRCIFSYYSRGYRWCILLIGNLELTSFLALISGFSWLIIILFLLFCHLHNLLTVCFPGRIYKFSCSCHGPCSIFAFHIDSHPVFIEQLWGNFLSSITLPPISSSSNLSLKSSLKKR